jgi:hypothetical protein
MAPRGPVDEEPSEPGWWLASDGRWWPPESRLQTSPTTRPSQASAPRRTVPLAYVLMALGLVVALGVGGLVGYLVRGEVEGLKPGECESLLATADRLVDAEKRFQDAETDAASDEALTDEEEEFGNLENELRDCRAQRARTRSLGLDAEELIAKLG